MAHHTQAQLSSGALPATSRRQHEGKPFVQPTRASERLNATSVIHLQRVAGNAAVNRLIQAKLTVGAAHDPLEQEADRVADRVVSGATNAAQTSQAGAKGIHRNVADEDELMTKRDDKTSSFDAGSDFESRLNSAGGGQPLDGKTRAKMEAGIGADFGKVRVHTNAYASQLNRSISAKAFTRGSDVFFDRGQYNPGSTAGQHLLAHELTHVVQQGGAVQGNTAQRKTADIQRKSGDEDVPQVKQATEIIRQAVKKTEHTSVISSFFEEQVAKAQEALQPVPALGIKRNTHDYFESIKAMRSAAYKLSSKDEELFDQENEGKQKQGEGNKAQGKISLWKRANLKRAANASAVISHRKAQWTSSPGKLLGKAMNMLVTGHKYKNSIARASWSYRDALRKSPEYNALKVEYRAFKDSADYATDNSGGFVRSIEPSVFIPFYATRIATSIHDKARPEAPWYQPTLRAEHRKAEKDVSDWDKR